MTRLDSRESPLFLRKKVLEKLAGELLKRPSQGELIRFKSRNDLVRGYTIGTFISETGNMLHMQPGNILERKLNSEMLILGVSGEPLDQPPSSYFTQIKKGNRKINRTGSIPLGLMFLHNGRFINMNTGRTTYLTPDFIMPENYMSFSYVSNCRNQEPIKKKSRKDQLGKPNLKMVNW